MEAFGYTNQFCVCQRCSSMTPEEQRQLAHREADEALGAYWNALEGTIGLRTKFRMQLKRVDWER